MEEDKIKKLFDSYEPELTSDKRFMASLERQFGAVESIKTQLAQHRRSQRLAMSVAAVVGFILGVVSTLCYPIVADALCSAAASTSSEAVYLINNYGTMIMSIDLCIVTMAVTYVAYDLTLIISGNFRSLRVRV